MDEKYHLNREQKPFNTSMGSNLAFSVFPRTLGYTDYRGQESEALPSLQSEDKLLYPSEPMQFDILMIKRL